MPYIYKITNLVNDKIYIGKHRSKISVRDSNNIVTMLKNHITKNDRYMML